MIDRNKERSVNIRLIRGEVAILARLNSLDVYYSNIVPEARNRLPRVSVRNSLLGLVPQTYLLVNVYAHTQGISTDTDALHQNSTAKTWRHEETAPSGHRESANIFIEKFHRKTDWSKSYYAFRGLPIDFDGSTINRGNLATVFHIDFL